MQSTNARPATFNGETPATLSGGNPSSAPPPSRVLLTVKQQAAEQPALFVGGIRWQIFNRHTNGLEKSGAIVRNGARVYLDREKYLAWLAGEVETSAVA